jgi:hypothetical protein
VLPLAVPKFRREEGIVAYELVPMRKERVGRVAEQGNV